MSEVRCQRSEVGEPSNEKGATSNKQRATSNKQRETSIQQRATRKEQQATRNQQRVTSNERAFTLLEVLIVLFILGMIAVMAWPALGILDDRAREERTCERMEVIRRAIVGDPDRFDADGRRIIGGYVGDMEKWPDLWEAKAEVVPPDCDSACNEDCPDGDPFSFGFRPAGKFVEKRWKWCRPFRKVLDGGDVVELGLFEYKEPDGAGYVDTSGPDDVWHIGKYDHNDYCNDHIGGLETENEGQPRALWTDDPKEDVSPTEMEDPDKWKGPYMAPPMDECLKDSLHWAETCDEYYSLEPTDTWHLEIDPPPPPGICVRATTSEDGDYPGEHYDEKESFRLLQTDGRLSDGWGRAFRFFITADQDRPGSTIFWIISEGPDKEGTYPTKGTFGTTWTDDPDDIMSKAYDETDEYNKDNIAMKIYSHEWEAIFEEINEKKKTETEDIFLRIKKAILGSSPSGMNDGFTGDVCRWPKLFRWEDNGTPDDPTDDYWDDQDGTPVSYTKGQIRELWTRTPNSDPIAGATDDVAVPAWAHAGIGWRGEYFQTPWGINGEQFVRDAWDREVLFFKDDTNDVIMILSRGADGKFDFYDTDTLPEGAPDGFNDYLEPASFTEAIDVTTYNPNDAGGHNADNIVLIVKESDWYPGFFTLNKFTVNNAVSLTTKACLFYDDGSTDIRVANRGNSEDGNFAGGVWDVGSAPPPPYAFNYTDSTPSKIKTGARYLIFWNDADGDNLIDAGENQYTAIYNIITNNSMEPRDNIILDTTVDFSAAP